MTTEPATESAAGVAASAQHLITRAFPELTGTELYGLLQLRSQVFVVEQDCVFLDLDGVDMLPDTIHAFIPAPAFGLPEVRPMVDSHGAPAGLCAMPAAYARVLPAGFIDGPAGEPASRSIGRVVTDPGIRGKRLGSTLMRSLVARFGPETVLTLNGQSHLRGFYETFGFTVSGDEFIEDGIPHLPMRRPRG
ncbi:GNAT family N-acetyltransferase [Brevibacterium sp. 50QC2O2]|uniref:GNAT family N-acetyltransferase n=1 Tax=Brevibacterium TaxID=1696 RepID=UPI00211BE96F|nr:MULTISPECIES: GNAT family N-acetyltransferase [unclassified Brevibacterium]MCQ9366973.1 GNAT family N-acetyltransferase [Brevibacterium sp. 91QC2O2]MCQ9384122.1 GNAT family N-acetyltransferase [Brevibacterium sp. 68QC2CO]MCQ9388400.1 GNAT family N-acetyltransferase [Brevibacterium sp. 50QC2O2]